ncbi:ATP-binding protein [Marivibrio halodurans]|uniref:ATP-binding protein n=1 Tax=Marivibrio halodurans TaxID=2039722 RepID=A0A8J7S8I4_9PROT|nr:ATP-binding protein [Marivibrio halodurans]MBP5858834.1 ATP-binding protein [Marivibrio halodurans]
MIEAEKIADDGFDETDVFVGKDVLDLLSSSMYVNPLSIFREYVQNATDAIDDAVKVGLLPSIDHGRIEVNLDHIDRRVVIRDNGIGLANNEFSKRMLSFGASVKRGTDARGFRGVGRLSALGYVQQLVFRSRTKGDTKVLEASWDGRAVKRTLASADADSNLQTIVSEAVTLKRLEPEDYPAHFFEVELVKPRRISNDKLLNEVEIETFISQVCPCPFSPDFAFGEEINELLAPHGRAGRSYNIHINGMETPVYRPYSNKVAYSDTKTSALRSLRCFEIESIDGGTGAIGWLIHHDYQGAIPVSQGVRGLRARVGNIQVGHDRLFLEVFPEDRFCSWTIGEVHVLDARVVPNGRRDEFEGNAHLDNIIAHLRPIGAEVARECRLSSQKRNRLKTFELAADKVYEKLEILKQGAISDHLAKSIKAEIGTLLSEMRKVAEFDLFEDEGRRALKGQLREAEKAVDAHTTKSDSDVLESVPARKRPTYKEVFDLIYDCSVNQVAAKSLIDRMLNRLSRS